MVQSGLVATRHVAWHKRLGLASICVFVLMVPLAYSSSDGKTWVGSEGRLGYLQGDHYFPLPAPPVENKPVWPTATQAITTSDDGDVWISLNGWPISRIHNAVWNLDNTLFHKIGTAVTLTTDHAGRIWAGYMKNVVSIHEGDKVRFLDRNQGLNVGNVTALHESESHMWVGGEHGLNLFENDGFVTMTFAGQSALGGITGIVFADEGGLWLNASAGIFRISAQEVATFLKNPLHVVKFEAFNYLDGIPGDAGILYPLPTAIKGTDGRLWFATTGGLVFINPTQIVRNNVIPPVALRSVRADGRSIETDAGVQLPKGTKSLEIDYTALSFSVPERVRFKYKLEGSILIGRTPVAVGKLSTQTSRRDTTCSASSPATMTGFGIRRASPCRSTCLPPFSRVGTSRSCASRLWLLSCGGSTACASVKLKLESELDFTNGWRNGNVSHETCTTRSSKEFRDYY